MSFKTISTVLQIAFGRVTRPLLIIALLSSFVESRAQSFQSLLQTNLFQPGGVGVTPMNRYIIADTGNHRLIEFNPDTRQVRVLAGGELGVADGKGSEARFRSPQGVLALPDKLIIADTGNHLIREVAYDGTVLTVVGDFNAARSAEEDGGIPQGSDALRSPSGMAYDGADTVYIADTGNNAILKYSLSSKTVESYVREGLSRPTGLAVGRNGRIYIADSGTHSILSYAPGEGMQRLAGRGSAFDFGMRNSSVGTSALFKSPTSLYYREVRDELIVADSGNGLLRLISNASAGPGLAAVDTFANTSAAGFTTPIAVARDAAGIYLVLDAAQSALHGVITVHTPRLTDPKIGRVILIIDPTTGSEIAVLDPVTDETFENDVIIAISGDTGGVHHYTFGEAPVSPFDADSIPLPTEDSTTAPNFRSPSPPSPLPDSLVSARPNLRVKAITTAKEGEERIPSRIVEATFRFQAATPVIDAKKLPGAVIFETATANASIWYTLDGSTPVNDPTRPNVHGPVPSGASIPLIIGPTNLTIKARAFRPNFKDSAIAIAEFSPTNFVPNRISLGFEYGEASSAFFASPGQRFYAPVTLSLLPNAQAYSMQFNIKVAPETGPPATDYQMNFRSMFYMKVGEGSRYVQIPPMTFYGIEYLGTNITITNIFGEILFSTNVMRPFPVFTNLVFVNNSEHLMGVGWIERHGETNLYDTRRQHLWTYSLPHDTVFQGAQGKAVPGGFSFKVPSNARVNDTYIVSIGQPSATADGIGQDIYIDAPGMNSPSPVKAVRRLTVRPIPYIVGDVAPFRWFNAGDFGDTNILNNDLSQIHQSVAYGYNYPPIGSDFFDAMDTCCVTLSKGAPPLNWDLTNGDDLIINQIAYGDGVLDIADIYVAFRRSLDPSLVWYRRSWQNGELVAEPIPGEFRDRQAERQSESSVPAFMIGAGADPEAEPALAIRLGTTVALPGELVQIPVLAKVDGPHPLRTLSLSVEAEDLRRTAPLLQTLSFTTTEALGHPTASFNQDPGRLAVSWVFPDRRGFIGERVIGSITLRVPPEADPFSVLRLRLSRVSGTPNGLTRFPITTGDALVVMANRPQIQGEDGIPDSWRLQHFGSLNSPLAPANLDPDGDGLSNLQEYKAGTNPMNWADALRLKAQKANGQVQLRFRSVQGKRYLLEQSADLENPVWAPLGDVVTGTGAELQVTSSDAAPIRYYRIRLAE